MFAGTLGPQDASFDWVASHNHAAGEIVRAHPDVAKRRCIRGGWEPGVHVRAHEAARGQRPIRWTRSSNSCAPRWPPSQDCMVFMQNPPPITVSGQNSPSAYQLTLQSVNLKEIYDWAPQLTNKMRDTARLRGRQ